MTLHSADDLRALIRDIATDEPNPAVVTDKILRNLTAAEFRVVATVALHEFVRRAMTHPIAPDPVTYETANGARTASPKVAAIRDWVERELRRPLCIDETAAVWRHLAQCSAADLTAAAAIRHRKATQNTAEAERLEGVAKAVEHAGVATVADLPRDTLEEVLKR